ncbi:hypothetical protein ABVK25_005442 [Lepraria finkii]|uniref:Toll-like receptor 2 n=1 Tax=Lepraria finkii TaxID=1340010 RepID=A0ABR4BBU0_9LECA
MSSFFRTNRFECDLNDTLPMFLVSSMKSLFRSHESSTFPATNFNQEPWIRKLKTTILCDGMEYDLSQELALPLNLRCLQRLDIKIFDKPSNVAESTLLNERSRLL